MVYKHVHMYISALTLSLSLAFPPLIARFPHEMRVYVSTSFHISSPFRGANIFIVKHLQWFRWMQIFTIHIPLFFCFRFLSRKCHWMQCFCMQVCVFVYMCIFACFPLFQISLHVFFYSLFLWLTRTMSLGVFSAVALTIRPLSVSLSVSLYR